MSNGEYHVRVASRPTLPPFLALVLLFSLPVGLGLAYDFMRFNGDKVFLFFFVPLVVWLFYGRRTRRNGRTLRAFTTTLVAPFLVLGLFSGWQWVNYDTHMTGHYGLTKRDLCYHYVPNMKLGKVSENNSYNNCEYEFPDFMREEICTRLKSQSERFPSGFERCSALYQNSRLH